LSQIGGKFKDDMPIVKKLRLRLMRAIGMIIEDIILLISSAFLEIMLNFALSSSFAHFFAVHLHR